MNFTGRLPFFWLFLVLLSFSGSVSGQGLEEYRELFPKTDIDSLRASNTKPEYCITVDASKSVDPGNPGLVFEWEIDGMEKLIGTKVQPCFKEPGVYMIHLNIVDPSSKLVNVHDTSMEVYISDNVRFTYRGRKNANSLLYFSVPREYRERHKGSRYIWLFPGNEVKVGPRTSTIFSRNGNYEVKLLEIKEDGDEIEIVSGYQENIPVNITVRDN